MCYATLLWLIILDDLLRILIVFKVRILQFARMSPPFDKGNIYRVDDNKFLKGRAWLRGIKFSPHKPTPRSLESIRKSTAITNLGENITTYLDNNFDVKKSGKQILFVLFY